MKRVLIIGASSFIGTRLALHLSKRYRVYGTYFQHRPSQLFEHVPTLQLVVRDNAPVEKVLSVIEPDTIIYCPSITNFKRCEEFPGMSYLINAEAPARLAKAAQALGIRFIYLSTSMVYSGLKGSYREKEIPKPRGTYGTTKLQGENLLKDRNNAFILRLGTLYGLGDRNQNSILNRMLDDLWAGKPTNFINDEFRNFIWVNDFAKAIEKVIEAPNDAAGTYNISSTERTTYFDFASNLAKILGLDTKLVLPIAGKNFARANHSNPDSRGKDLTMLPHLFEGTFDYTFQTTSDALTEIRTSLNDGTY